MTRNFAFLKDLGALTIGSIALLIAGVQPILLGALAHDNRLTVNEIGLAATVELLMLGLACGLAAARFNAVRVRPILVAASLAHAAINVFSIPLGGVALVLVRGASGVAEGVMLWTAISTIMHSRSPERYTGLFVIWQALTQTFLAAALALLVIPAWGPNGAFMLMAAISVLAAGLSLRGHESYEPLAKGQSGEGTGISLKGAAGLLCVFFFMSFSVGLWVYLEPLAVHAGMSQEDAGGLIALSLVAQLAGGLAATAIGPRWSPFLSLLIGGILNLGVAAILQSGPTGLSFTLASMGFGFLWIFMMPFQTQLLIRIDPSRRTAMQLGTAQLLGCAFGPLSASLLLSDATIGEAPAFFATFMVVAIFILVGLSARRRTVPAGLVP